MDSPGSPASPASKPKKKSGPPPGQAGANVKRLAAAGLLFLAGICAIVSAAVPWWILSGSGLTGGSGTAQFLPGDSYNAASGGASASLTYAGQGLGPVGALYEGILGIAIGVGALSMLVGIIAIVGALGRIRDAKRYSTILNLSVLLVVLTVALAVMVPLVQPPAFRAANPNGLCTSTGGLGTPCKTFWGSAHSGSASVTWGADVGWYLWVSIAVFLVGAIVVWAASSSESWGSGTRSGSATPVDLDKLAQLKLLADSGHITPAEFQEVKSRILGIEAATPSVAQGPSGPEEELRRLKAIHDSGVITDQEYDDLRKRVLAKM